MNPGRTQFSFYKTWICVPCKCIVLFVLQPSKQNLGTYSQELSPCEVSADQKGEILEVDAWIAVWGRAMVRQVRELRSLSSSIPEETVKYWRWKKDCCTWRTKETMNKCPLCEEIAFQRIPWSCHISTIDWPFGFLSTWCLAYLLSRYYCLNSCELCYTWWGWAAAGLHFNLQIGYNQGLAVGLWSWWAAYSRKHSQTCKLVPWFSKALGRMLMSCKNQWNFLFFEGQLEC